MTMVVGVPEQRVQPEWFPARSDRRPDPARSFAYTPEARRLFTSFRGRSTIVRLESVDNDVLGVPRWVPFAEVWAGTGARMARQWLDNPVIQIAEGDDPRLVLATGTPVILFGVDNHRHEYARAVIDHLRSTCRTVLVVDMGTTLHDLAYADIATFGYDQEHGAALVDLLAGDPLAA
ncbi:hypothetical protein ACPPVQ_08055 [Diaminobutyricibacter sp. McL0618]|uniref:hypothetical protein n=1 Tax=Leifsonia sp. McL0618 TaxID=3415677 RepID=UPI003CE90CB5